MSNNFTWLFLLVCLLGTFPTFGQQPHADCVDAYELVNVPTPLSMVPDYTVDSMTTSGSEPAELQGVMAIDCGPDGYPNSLDLVHPDKFHWISFSATTTGTLEFMIYPENQGTDYDFAIWKGGCPGDACAEPIYCIWRPSLCLYTPTGVAVDPLATFGEDPGTSLQIIADSILLEAGENYYLLIENQNEFGACGVEDSLGFTIQFDGTATIAPLLPPPTTQAILPTNTTITACENDTLTLAVEQVPFASNYDWTSMTTIGDANITLLGDGDTVGVRLGTTSGQICMDMVCPIDTTICWDISVAGVPDIEALPDDTVFCESVDLATRITDLAGVTGGIIQAYPTQTDAENEQNPLPSNTVNQTGNYWVRKSVSTECFDITQVAVTVESVEIEPVMDTTVCGTTQLDLAEINVLPTNGIPGGLSISFYKDSLDAVMSQMEILPPFAILADASNVYWLKAELQTGGNCFDLKSFSVDFAPAPDIQPIAPQEACSNRCLDINNLPLVLTNGTSGAGLNRAVYTSVAAAENADPTELVANPICSSGTYYLRVFDTPACYDVEELVVTILPAPEVADTTLLLDCQTGCIDLASQGYAELNGLNPAVLAYSFFATQAEAENPSAMPLSSLNICNPDEVWLRVQHDNGCADIARITVDAIDRPAATLSGDASLCTGTSSDLQFDLTGIAPFTVVYNNGTTDFSFTTSQNAHLEPVLVDSNRVFTIISVTDGNGCVGSATGTATITALSSPEITNFSQDCNLAATEYTVSFELSGGDAATYQVGGTPGTLSGNQFVSTPLPSGVPYNFQVADGNACPPVEVAGVFSCSCSSMASDMDLMPVKVCEREVAIGFDLGGEVLEKGDTLVYVLHDNPGNTLGNIVATASVPLFMFDAATMATGQTYYLSSVVTKKDSNGQPILNSTANPCLSVGQGTPVTFSPVPDGRLSLATDTICVGDAMALTFHMEGVGPFDVIFFDGEKSEFLMGIDSGYVEMVSADSNADFYLQTINPTGLPGCRMDFINPDVLTLTVEEPPVVSNFQIDCNQEGSLLVVSFDITGENPADFTVNGLSGTLSGNRFVSDSIPHNTPYRIEISEANACAPTLLQGTAECLCLADFEVTIETSQPISCRGEQDAELRGEVMNGTAPFTWFWSNGDSDEVAQDVPAGEIFVLVTDANNCQTSDTVFLEEPLTITASTNVVPISCVDENDGGILIVNVEGGTGNYQYSFDQSPFTSNNIRENLAPGTYQVAVRDENDCEWTDEVMLVEPELLTVELGEDLIVNLGDSVRLMPQINDNQITVNWESDNANFCDTCLSPVLYPEVSGFYEIHVTNSSGCEASDEVYVQLQNNRRIFLPNVFTPNDDGLNEEFYPMLGPEVSEVKAFQIYNRWGQMLYERERLLSPGESIDPNLGWNGLMPDGQPAPAGVYVFVLEVVYLDGDDEVIRGDVTLIR